MTTAERLPLSATLHVNSMLQCGRCLGYLCPTQLLRFETFTTEGKK